MALTITEYPSLKKFKDVLQDYKLFFSEGSSQPCSVSGRHQGTPLAFFGISGGVDVPDESRQVFPITLIYADPSDNPPTKNLDPRRIKRVLGLKTVLHGAQIPYEEKPSRGTIARALIRRMNDLGQLASELIRED